MRDILEIIMVKVKYLISEKNELIIEPEDGLKQIKKLLLI